MLELATVGLLLAMAVLIVEAIRARRATPRSRRREHCAAAQERSAAAGARVQHTVAGVQRRAPVDPEARR
jgi:heme exporter protein D